MFELTIIADDLNTENILANFCFFVNNPLDFDTFMMIKIYDIIMTIQTNKGKIEKTMRE